MPKKFSLKDNPIFQRLGTPEPPAVEPPAEEPLPSEGISRPSNQQKLASEGHNMTVNTRPSKFDPHDLTPKESPAQYTPSPATSSQVESPQSQQPSAHLSRKDHFDKSWFFSFFNEMVDDLLPMLDPNEQVLYVRLFRLSYGFNRNYCTVSQSLLIERTGFSRNTIRTSLQSLVQKGWIYVTEAGNRISTTYEVVLPRDKSSEAHDSGLVFDGQNLTLNNRPSEVDAHDMILKNRDSESNPLEGQNLALRNLTLTNKPADPSLKARSYVRGSNFEGHGLPPLLNTFTNNSLTLPKRERGLISEGQNLPLTSVVLSARELVDKFYSNLGQRPSKTKRKKSIEECANLLLEGFTVEEVDYAVGWLTRHHPTTGSFSRLAHFIDQALKVQQAEQHAHEVKQIESNSAEHRRAEQQRMEQERRHIDEVKTSLPQEVLDELYQEAKRLIEQESPQLKFGKDLMIRVKLNELVKWRYLP